MTRGNGGALDRGLAASLVRRSVYGVFVPRRPRRVTATDYRSAYDHRAGYFSDRELLEARTARRASAADRSRLEHLISLTPPDHEGVLHR